MKQTLLAAVLVLGTSAALAQAPAAPAPAAAPSGPPPNTCGKAPEWPGPERTNRQTIEFDKNWKTWSTCAREYMDKNRPIYQAYGKAIGELADEYNAVVDKVKKDSDAEKKK